MKALPEVGRTRLSQFANGTGAVCLLVAMLLSRTISLDSWYVGNGQVGRWVEAFVCLGAAAVFWALKRTGASPGLRQSSMFLAVSAAVLEGLCLAAGVIFSNQHIPLDSWRMASVFANSTAVALAAYACLASLAQIPLRRTAFGVAAAFCAAELLGAGVPAAGASREDLKLACAICLLCGCTLTVGAGFLAKRGPAPADPALATSGAPSFQQARAGVAACGPEATRYLAAPSLACGFAAALLLGATAQVAGVDAEVMRSTGASLACALILGVGAALLHRRPLTSARATAAFAITAMTGCLLMGLPPSPAAPAAGRILLVVLTALVWSLAARESQARNSPAAAGIALGALQAGVLLGRAAGASLPQDLQQPGALALLWILGCVAVAVAAANRPRLAADASAGAPRQQGLLPRSWGLSPRETEVARAVLRGEGRSRIAQQLGVSEETVKTYVRRLYAKAGVRSREELENAALDGQGDNPSDSCTPL